MATAEVHHLQTVDMETCEPDGGLLAFTDVRPRLFAIACRMLQSSAEAEDVVQDVWLRWQQTNRSVVQDVPAFLAKTTIRLCLNIVQSARSRCDTFVDSWIPERVDSQADPESGAIRSAELKLAIMMLLERLSPSERAAYVLREAFDYSYRQIANTLRIAEANSRQLVVRARKRLAEERRASVTPTEQKRLLDAFVGAALKGDLTDLENLLAKDAASYANCGRLARAARLPVFGNDRVSDFAAMSSRVVEHGDFLCGARLAGKSFSPMGTINDPKDIAADVVCLVGASHVSGEVLYVDDGAHVGKW